MRPPCFGFDTGQGEPAPGPPAGPPSRQSLVRDRLDAEPGHGGRPRFEGQFVDLGGPGRLPGKNRAVRQHVQFRTADDCGLDGLEDSPRTRPGIETRNSFLFPGTLRVLQFPGRRVEDRLQSFDLVDTPLQFVLVAREHVLLGRDLRSAVRRIVENRVELVILALLEGIVLVVVALRAAYGRAQPDRGGRVDAILDGRVVELVVL